MIISPVNADLTSSIISFGVDPQNKMCESTNFFGLARLAISPTSIAEDGMIIE